MTDRNPERPNRVEPDELDRERRLDESVVETEPTVARRPVDDRGGFQDTAPNPHDEEGTEQTAARAAGTITGMFFPVVIIAIVAIIVILLFVL